MNNQAYVLLELIIIILILGILLSLVFPRLSLISRLYGVYEYRRFIYDLNRGKRQAIIENQDYLFLLKSETSYYIYGTTNKNYLIKRNLKSGAKFFLKTNMESLRFKANGTSANSQTYIIKFNKKIMRVSVTPVTTNINERDVSYEQ